MATVSYTISLLDGTLCYDSKTEGPKQFKVGKDIVESGVHQAVELMHAGDKGLFIIPSKPCPGPCWRQGQNTTGGGCDIRHTLCYL